MDESGEGRKGMRGLDEVNRNLTGEGKEGLGL